MRNHCSINLKYTDAPGNFSRGVTLCLRGKSDLPSNGGGQIWGRICVCVSRANPIPLAHEPKLTKIHQL